MVARGTRFEAKLAGRVRYFTDQPCKHGHVAERWTSSGDCTVCVLQRQRQPKNRAKQAAWRQANVEKVAAYKAAWRERRKVARLLP